MLYTEKQKSLISFFLCTLIVLVVVFAVIGIELWWISNYKIQQTSMEPTLSEGDIVWANKAKKPTYGDIILIKVKEGYTTDVFIKRAVAFGCDLVWVEESTVQDGMFYLCVQKKDEATENKYVKEVYDGNTLELMGYANVPTRDDGFAAIGKQFAIEVAENHVYCIGDNRADSYDSRNMGALPLEDLVGVVVAKGMGVFWSITIPVAIVLLGVGLLIYFPFKKKEKQ